MPPPGYTASGPLDAPLRNQQTAAVKSGSKIMWAIKICLEGGRLLKAKARWVARGDRDKHADEIIGKSSGRCAALGLPIVSISWPAELSNAEIHDIELKKDRIQLAYPGGLTLLSGFFLCEEVEEDG